MAVISSLHPKLNPYLQFTINTYSNLLSFIVDFGVIICTSVPGM